MYHSGIRRRIRQTQLSFRSQHHKSSPDTNALVENSAAKAEPIQMNPEQQCVEVDPNTTVPQQHKRITNTREKYRTRLNFIGQELKY
jgi:hypothetical protein